MGLGLAHLGRGDPDAARSGLATLTTLGALRNELGRALDRAIDDDAQAWNIIVG